MTGKLLPPELEREVSGLKKRVSDLEKKLDRRLAAKDVDEAIFYFDGILAAVTSGVWRPRRARRVSDWMIALVEPGSTPTVLWVLKNGENVLTITIPAGTLEIEETTPVHVRPGFDRLQIQIASAGIDAFDLTVQGETSE